MTEVEILFSDGMPGAITSVTTSKKYDVIDVVMHMPLYWRVQIRGGQVIEVEMLQGRWITYDSLP